jgi:hypothetical protein
MTSQGAGKQGRQLLVLGEPSGRERGNTREQTTRPFEQMFEQAGDQG